MQEKKSVSEKYFKCLILLASGESLRYEPSLLMCRKDFRNLSTIAAVSTATQTSAPRSTAWATPQILFARPNA